MKTRLQHTTVTLAVTHTGKHTPEYLAELIAERAWKLESVEVCEIVPPQKPPGVLARLREMVTP
jgi:hypothetical protein